MDFAPAERVIRVLEQLIEWRGKPQALRCDNGPEYVSAALTTWAEQRVIRLEYIQPGKPQQNAYIEALQPDGAIRLAGTVPVHHDRRGTGVCHPLALDL